MLAVTGGVVDTLGVSRTAKEELGSVRRIALSAQSKSPRLRLVPHMYESPMRNIWYTEGFGTEDAWWDILPVMLLWLHRKRGQTKRHPLLLVFLLVFRCFVYA